MEKQRKDKILCVRIPAELHKRYEAAAIRERVVLSELVRKAVNEKIEKITTFNVPSER